MRLAWLVANPQIMAKLDLVKGATDLHTPAVTQRECALYMENYDFEGHIKENCALYAKRRDAMVAAIKKYFPADTKCTYPHGGLFLWVELPEHIDARKLFATCIANDVAYVPGDSFFPASRKKNYFRLNFSYNDEATIEEGIRRLGEAIKSYKD